MTAAVDQAAGVGRESPGVCPEVAAIGQRPDLSLGEALGVVRERFDAAAIVGRSIDPRQVAEYYNQSDRGYRLFHCREGALHIALGCDGHRDTSGFSRQASLFAERIERVDARHAIELGCGNGFNVRWLAERCPDRTFLGVDLTESHIRNSVKASRQLPNAQFAVANYEGLEYPDASFDAAYSIESLCQTASQERALREACRVLRPGSTLMVVDCFRTAPLSTFDADLAEATQLVEKSTAVNAFAELGPWRELAGSVGFREVGFLDLTAETGQNLDRLYRVARRYFRMSLVAKAMSRAMPPLLLENAACGLLMPYTVGLGSLGYYAVTFEKA
ncbi:MAG: class I SAM-dependent methyltransferase [Planctomycetota bacterium]